LMFWIIPRPSMAGIMKLIDASKSTNVVKWGLPIPSEAADSEKARLDKRRRADDAAEQERQEKIEQLALEREVAKKAKTDAKEQRIAAQKQADVEKKQRIQKQQEKTQGQLKSKLEALVRNNKTKRTK
jgi:hypothetical protein